jgi:hypothetical protein
MAEIPLPSSQQPELDQSQMEIDPEVPIGLGDKVEIVSAPIQALPHAFHFIYLINR